jgi:hypothetical protein
MAAEVERLVIADLEAMSDDDAARLLAAGSTAPSTSARAEDHSGGQ